MQRIVTTLDKQFEESNRLQVTIRSSLAKIYRD